MSKERASSIFDKTVQHSVVWIEELMADLELAGARSAFRILRAALHALRDRLTVDEAVNLGAQLPMLLRGLYYEGWRPSVTPMKLRTRRSFFERVARELVEERDPDPERAARSVFHLIARHVSTGEVEQIRGMLPAELADLWPQEDRSSQPSGTGAKVARVPPGILQAVAARVPKVEKPTVERIATQHTELHALIDAIGAELGTVCEGSSAETAGGTEKRELPTLMSELREGVSEHFSLEDAAGFVARAISAAPQLSRRAAAFRKQHATLLARATGLADEAVEAAAAASKSRWTAFRADFLDFAEAFRDHELAESSLLQDAYLRDEGWGG